jgi:predicted glycoside hydrolase/deacetylase ChbG (UPF0249 family)
VPNLSFNKTELKVGALIINADDWGRDRLTTDNTFDCFLRGTVSAVSGMVFMEDSERAAALTREHGIDTGLHINFTTPFTSHSVAPKLKELQADIGAYLRRHSLAKTLYHPGLTRKFEYVLSAQMDEFERIYDERPMRFDGHHHMHLCANVLFGGLIPSGSIMRRNFSFESNEKSWVNRLYRKYQDRYLSRRHHMVGRLFNITPMERTRLQRIFRIAQSEIVELETHPVLPDEHLLLASDEMLEMTEHVVISNHRGKYEALKNKPVPRTAGQTSNF